jgi:hypothetical protein
MERHVRILIGCCFTMMAALLVVGFVSHGVTRHIVQTSPYWIAIVLGFRGSRWSKWAGLPCFALWLLLMINIWLTLLGLPHLMGGTFSPTEVAMTVVVGLAAAVGTVAAVRIRAQVPAWSATAVILLVLVLELGAIRVSFLPAIAHR